MSNPAVNIISKETAARLLAAYRELEAGKGLREELVKQTHTPIDPRRDVQERRSWQSGLWRTGIEMAVPYGEGGKRLLQVQTNLALQVIDAHLTAMRAELIEASAQAQKELAGETSNETETSANNQ